MKTSALPPGRRLNGRNPAHAHAPASANARCASSGWTVTASIAKNPNAIAASVAASPSMLSSRLNAFVMPTSQKIASGHATKCVWINWTPVPVESTITAAAICSASFSFGESARRSSTSPATKRSDDPGVDPGDLLATPGSRPTRRRPRSRRSVRRRCRRRRRAESGRRASARSTGRRRAAGAAPSRGGA